MLPRESNDEMKNRVEELFHEIVDLPADERARFLAACGVDETTRQEVEALLAFDLCADTTLEEEIGQMAQGALARFAAKDTRCVTSPSTRSAT